MSHIRFAPSSAFDFLATGGPLAFRARAVTAILGDEVIGIGGVCYLPDGELAGFARLTDAIRRKPIALHKAALAFLREARARGVKRVVAQADPTQPAAERWLLRLGFKDTGTMCDGKAVFIWHA